MTHHRQIGCRKFYLWKDRFFCLSLLIIRRSSYTLCILPNLLLLLVLFLEGSLLRPRHRDHTLCVDVYHLRRPFSRHLLFVPTPYPSRAGKSTYKVPILVPFLVLSPLSFLLPPIHLLRVTPRIKNLLLKCAFTLFPWDRYTFVGLSYTRGTC